MIRAALRFVPNRWWALSSWLALRPYVRFRIQTMYGGEGRLRQVKVRDVVIYLAWVRDFKRFEAHGWRGEP